MFSQFVINNLELVTHYEQPDIRETIDFFNEIWDSFYILERFWD